MSGEKGFLRRLLLPTLPASAGQSWAVVPRPWFPSPATQLLLMASTRPSSSDCPLQWVLGPPTLPSISSSSGLPTALPLSPATAAAAKGSLDVSQDEGCYLPHHAGLLKVGSSKPASFLSRVSKARVKPGGRLRRGDRQGAADGDALLGEVRRYRA